MQNWDAEVIEKIRADKYWQENRKLKQENALLKQILAIIVAEKFNGRFAISAEELTEAIENIATVNVRKELNLSDAEILILEYGGRN